MRNILLPTDFSKNAWNAITFALQFFREHECTFYLLHTYTPAFYRMDYLVGGPSFSAVPDVGVDRALAGLEKTLTDIEANYKNSKHSFKTVSAFNQLTDEINEISREKEIDMVVMGTRGATNAREIFLGTNTVYMIRKAIVPVLVIPEQITFTEVNKILFATDYWSKYKEDEFRSLSDMALLTNAEITILHLKEEYDLSEKQLKNKQFIEKYLEDIPHVFEDIKGVLMPGGIMTFINEQKFNLLVMMNRRHSLFERLLWPQNIDQIGFQVNIPFLVIPDTSKVKSLVPGIALGVRK